MKIHWTGERLETFIYNETTIEHLHRYAIAQQLVEGKIVLDIACGEGYGSNLLANRAEKVTGVDISNEVIINARLTYKKPNLQFFQGSTDKIPCETGTIDVVVSFETIEHHDKHETMMEEIRRVLKPDGILIISSPDKKYYSIIPNYNNPFHVKELFEVEFKELVKKYFKFHYFLSQISGFNSLVFEEKALEERKITGFQGDYKSIGVDESCGPVYWIAIASNLGLVPIKIHPLFKGDIVLEKKLDQVHQLYQNSLTYKIGKFILLPLKTLKLIWKWMFPLR